MTMIDVDCDNERWRDSVCLLTAVSQVTKSLMWVETVCIVAS